MAHYEGENEVSAAVQLAALNLHRALFDSAGIGWAGQLCHTTLRHAQHTERYRLAITRRLRRSGVLAGSAVGRWASEVGGFVNRRGTMASMPPHQSHHSTALTLSRLLDGLPAHPQSPLPFYSSAWDTSVTAWRSKTRNWNWVTPRAPSDTRHQAPSPRMSCSHSRLTSYPLKSSESGCGACCALTGSSPFCPDQAQWTQWKRISTTVALAFWGVEEMRTLYASARDICVHKLRGAFQRK